MFQAMSSLRPLALLAMGAAVGMGAQAQTRISINGVVADTIQTFSRGAMAANRASGITIYARGNTTGSGNSFVMPITEIYLGRSKYAGLPDATVMGRTVGSALEVERIVEDTGERLTITLANCGVDYHRRVVLCDATPMGGQTQASQPVYSFSVRNAMAMEPDVNGNFVLQESLTRLTLTPSMLSMMASALQLDAMSVAAIRKLDFGTLENKIQIALRKQVPAAPYTPQ